MGSYELTNVLFSKIKTLDPENAIKIMGYLLIQDLAEKDLIRLAYGPESLLHSLILRAKIQLGLSSNTSSVSSTPSSPSPLNPIARPTNANPFSQSSPRIPNGFDFGNNSSSTSSNCWPLSGFPNNSISPKASPLISPDNIRAGSFSVPVHSHQFSKDGGGGGGGDGWPGSDLIDEHQLSEYLSFLDESSSCSRPGDFIDPRLELGPGVPDWVHSVNNGDTHFHKRSYSASDACLGSEDPALGVGFKPCLYFARGFCKNGSNCKFVHGGFADSLDAPGAILGSPSNLDGFEQQEEMLRLKAQQQRLAAASQFMAGASSSSYNKYMNFLLQQQNDPQRFAAMMTGEELFKFGRCRPDRNELLAMASVERANSASRQIYLTFPAESTFRDEDVSEYFSKFGPVQDVRIPYQQKRMFGFVTFVFPETVRLILSKGNPHFICDSRVLVKPYKEKGKILDKRQQQQHLERGEFSSCLSPGGLDSRDAYDLPLGGRMFCNTQEVLLRRKLEEQAELQQAIELQGRRLMSLQLPDWKNERLTHHHRSLSVGAHGPPLSPHSHAQINQNILPFDSMEQEVAEGYSDIPAALISVTGAIAEQQSLQQSQKEDNLAFIHNNGNGNGKEEEQDSNLDAANLHKSAEQVLPDSLFASPTKSAGDHHLSELSTAVPEVNDTAITTGNNTLSSVNSAGFVASH